MDLLFKRAQTMTLFRRVRFRLWGKIELDEEETALIQRYRFRDAVLISQDQPGLLNGAISAGVITFFLLCLLGLLLPPVQNAFKHINDPTYTGGLWGMITISAFLAAFAGFWFYHENRETIYVRDLLRGRHFACDSVVDLARKEAWLETVCAYLRQVLESAKHWDGEVRTPIAALPKEQALEVVIRGL